MKPRPRLIIAAAWAAILLVALAASPPAALAERSMIPPPAINLGAGETEPKAEALAVPYAFHAESLDWAYGAAAGATGYLEKQMGLFGAVMGSSNGSKGVYLVAWNIGIPYTSRFFMDVSLSWGLYGDQRFYASADGGPAGSNGSDKGDYLHGEGQDNWVEVRFRYVMPWGHTRENPLPRYHLKEGLLVAGASGGETWNPLTSGITLLEFKPYWRERTLDDEDLGSMARRSLTTQFGITYNNTDFPTNPSKGSVTRLAITRDFGYLEDSDTWTLAEAEWAGYWDLGAGGWWGRQNVLAVDVWTAHSLTWEKNPDGSISNAPPPYMGANLGGFWRMRGYPMARFSDRSAIYYGAELRHIPRWQPLPEIGWINRWAKIDWWQVVAFAELGRVAEDWALDDLHSDMKWDAGVGLRIMAIKSVARLDFGYSDEGLNVWAMVGHPF